MPFGIIDTTHIDLPATIDANYINGLKTRAGVAFATILTQLDGRLRAFNNSVDAFVAEMITPPTDQLFLPQVNVSAFLIEEAGEYTIARPQFAEDIPSPMLPIRKWDASTMWTEDGLATMALESITLQYDSLLLGMRQHVRRQVLARLFSTAEIRIDPKSTATNPGFAGSGTGDNVFQTPFPNGAALPGGYSHYQRVVAANRASTLAAQRDKLKRWSAGPYDLVATPTGLAAIMADTATGNFVSSGSALVRPALGVAEAQVDPDKYVGVYLGDIRVHRATLDDVAETNGEYHLMFKSFGAVNPRNPLAWRYDPLFGRDAFIRSRSMFPLDQAVVIWRFGIGVANRVSVTITQVAAAAGAYQIPVIS